jgi:hypothetical protein
MPYYWNQTEQDLIEQYFYAKFSGSTSGSTRNRILCELSPKLEIIIRYALFYVHMPQTKENIQDCLIDVCINQLPNLKQEKLKGTQSFIYKCTIRFLYTKLVYSKKKRYEYDDFDAVDIVDNSAFNDPEYNLYIEDVRKEIIEQLDIKIELQERVDPLSTKSKFINKMKDFLIINDYDSREFNKWVMNDLKISPSTYSLLLKEFGISSKVFNEKLIKN